jgi:hypothetical protein
LFRSQLAAGEETKSVDVRGTLIGRQIGRWSASA